MKLRTAFPVVLAILAAAPPVLAGTGKAVVTLQQPGAFTDFAAPHLAEAFSAFLEQRAAARIAEDQRLEIVVTDVDMAGGFKPGDPGREHIRLMKSTFPPRIDLRFTLTETHDHVVAEGERTLRDLSYLMRPRPKTDPDPLVYEKQIVEGWLIREFGG